jgi:hypothetical protein
VETLIGSITTSRFGLDGRLGCEHADALIDSLNSPEISASELFRRFGPNALAAALAVIGLEADGGLGAPLCMSGPANPRLKPVLSEEAWAEAVPNLTKVDRLILSAGLLQIHGFWDDSHEAAQQADDRGERRLSAHWHAICHRREPDAANASYWTNRAGKNLVGARLAELVASSRDALSPDAKALAESLIRGGTFQDKAMIAACTTARRSSDAETLLRRVQKFEMAFLIGLSLERVESAM